MCVCTHLCNNVCKHCLWRIYDISSHLAKELIIWFHIPRLFFNKHTLKNCCWHLLCQDFFFLSAFLCGNKNVFKAWQVALWPLHCNWLWLLRFPAATSRGTKAAHLKPLTNHPCDKYCKNALNHLENSSKKVNSLTTTASPKFWILQKKNSSLRCNQQLENSTRHLHHLHPFFKAISQHRSF